MKFNKMLSLVLVISVLVTLFAVPVSTVAAEEEGTTLLNMFPDSDCNDAANINNGGNYWNTTITSEDVDGDENHWYTASTIGKEMVSGSTQRSTGMFLKLSGENKILADRKYVLNFTGKSIDGADTIGLTIGLGGDYKQRDVKKTAENFGCTFDAKSEDTQFAMAATTKGVSYKYAVDNVYLYDVTNAYEITADESVTISPESYTTIDGKKKTNAGDKVSFTVEVPHGSAVKSVKAGEEPVEPGADGKYSFTMPGNDVSITVETERVGTTLLNMFPDPNFDAGTTYVAKSGDKGGTVEVQEMDGENWAIAHANASSTSNWGNSSMVFACGGKGADENYLEAEHNYHVSFKAKAVVGSNFYYWLSGIYSSTFQPGTAPAEVVKETGVLQAATRIRLTPNMTNKATGEIAVTNLHVYDVTNAYEITADEGVTILPEYYTTIDGKKMTNAGDKVNFTVEAPHGSAVKSVKEGETPAELGDDGKTYSFTMPGSAVSITVETEQVGTTLTNLFHDPDCDNAANLSNGGNYWNTTIASEDVDGDGNHWYTASTIGKEMVSGSTQRYTGMFLKLSGENKILAGHKYTLNFTGKSIDGADTIGLTIGLGGDYKDRDVSETAENFSCTFDAKSEDTQFAMATKTRGVPYKFAIDNVYLYDVTNAYEITADENVTISPEYYTTIGGKKMTNVGDKVKFTVKDGVSAAKVLLNGREIQAEDGGTYQFDMTAEGADIAVVAYVDSIAYYINKDGSVLADAQEAGTRTLIVGVFDGDYMVNAEILEFNTTGKEEKTFNPEILQDGAAAGHTVRLFTWESLDNIKPLRAVYEQAIAN